MHGIDIRAIDLNLLVALGALLETSSVTEAARRSGVTQSSMSHNLGRLRELLGDPLLVRSGRGMQQTPRADALRAPTQRILAEIQRLLQAEVSFDPATSSRVFALACPDLLGALFPTLLARLLSEAPSIGLEVHRPLRGDAVLSLDETGDELGLGPPRPNAPGIQQRRLGILHWAVFGRVDHPALSGRLTRKSFAQYPHVYVTTGTPGPSFVDEAMSAAGIERTIGLTVESFLLALLAAAASDFLYTGPEEIIVPLAARLGLTYQPPPVPIPEVPVNAYWPERLQHDPGHRWLRDRVGAVVTEILAAT